LQLAVFHLQLLHVLERYVCADRVSDEHHRRPAGLQHVLLQQPAQCSRQEAAARMMTLRQQ